MLVRLEAMKKIHVEEIVALEKKCFPLPWTRESFLFELEDNKMAHYLVAIYSNRVVGYGGLWLILNEAHITNIAVDPGYRRKGVGEAITRGLIVIAAQYGANGITLEVRKSNFSAQNLYEKLGFRCVGSRKGYYQDNQEDALIMWLKDLKFKIT